MKRKLITLTLTLAQARGLATAASEGLAAGEADPTVVRGYFGSPARFKAAQRAATKLAGAVMRAEGRA